MKAVCLGGLLTVLLLAGAELILRVTRPDLKLRARSTLQFPELFDHLRNVYHRPDPRLLWKPQPGHEAGTIRISRIGFREAPGEPDPERYQVACMGNSVTFGYTTPEFEETYPAVLESLLVAGGCPTTLEVLNAGIVGYSSEQALGLYEESIRKQAPRVVTLLFGYNDHHFSGMTDARKMETRTGWTTMTAPLQRFHVYRALRKLILGRLPEAELQEVTPRVPLARFRENLTALVRRVRGDGATPILLTVPIRPEVPLVENPVPVVESSGARTWTDQLRWLLARLPEETRQQVVGLIFAGRPPTPATLQAIEPMLERAALERPSWPLPHYLRGLALEVAGRDSLASREFADSRRLDAEREMVRSYNDAVREIARAEGIGLVDLERLLAGPRPAGRFFHDVVHLTPAGNRRVADELHPPVATALGCGS